MTLMHKASSGSLQANHSTRLRNPTDFNAPSPTVASPDIFLQSASMLSKSSSTNQSLLSLDRNGETGQKAQTTPSVEFLPSTSFDDLQSSIESASNNLKFRRPPSPIGDGSMAEDGGLMNRKALEKSIVMAPIASSSSHGSIPSLPSTRPSRSGSLLRRPSTSSRQTSVSSTLSSSSGTLDAPTAPPLAMRSRRQSHYPPVSNQAVSRPRRSIGPATMADPDVTGRNSYARRASLLGDKGVANLDAPRPLANSRAAKAKSVQPPPRTSHANLLGVSDVAPEQNRLSALAPRSPRVGVKTSTPSSSKRMSFMPASHATGLGARTISPTDTRRMRRLSTMPKSQSWNVLATEPPPPPPPPPSLNMRAESRSPSIIPRKPSLTPSSARTTPDVNNRKSYSSGLSIGSTTSFNTVRTSTGSIQPRLQPSSSVTRLPTPKSASLHSSMQGEDDEDVPPVPAIPKAYESPKETSAETYFVDLKKSNLSAMDSTSIHSNSTGSISMQVHPEPIKAQQKAAARKSSYVGISSIEHEKKSSQGKKQLEPLRLPPLNIGPLSFPTASKRSHQDASQRDLSPLPSRQIHKSPTTPMTASRSSFFSKCNFDEPIELPSLRSSTSTHLIRRVTPTPPGGSSSDSSNFPEPTPKTSISPFLSSSLPKGGLEPGQLKRSRTGGGFATITGSFFDDGIQQKPAGPRQLHKHKLEHQSLPPKPPVPEPQAPEWEEREPRSPSSKTSLRRKLSLSWKRDKSKASADALENPFPLPQTKPENMVPPRIPASASATISGFAGSKQANPSASASASSSLADMESRRRKSSAASLVNYGTRDRVKSDTWSAYKEGQDSVTKASTRHASGGLASGLADRAVKPKASSTVLQTVGSWTTELDKDDKAAEEEMRKLGSRRKETEIAGRTIDALKKRATPKERVGPQDAIRIAILNLYERGEIVDYKDIYFCGTQNARKVVGDLQSDSPNFGYDDERGDYTIVPGDHLSYRYEIVDVLGKGSFGQVVRCIDHKLGDLVAIKIIRNKKRFHQQALVEVNILQKLREWDPKNKHSMVNFTQSFYFRGHLCISTELLDMNLYEFIKAHSFRGFSIRIIRRFTKQILTSLVLLKQRKVIHCDLKPENILLRHPLHSEIKVIDFGSSCFENEKVYTYIQSRFYRSPEVILGMTYSMPIDMWSVGCILAELYTGVPIFPGENEQEQLACIMEVFGPPEKHLIEKSTRKKLFFDSLGKPRLTVSSKGRRRRPSSKTLPQVLKCDDEAFLDFVARCLRWDPERRLRPEDAVRHEFITGQKTAAAAVPRLPARDASPCKRTPASANLRPLPDPPSSSVAAKSLGHPMRSGISPHKAVSGISRRTSGGVTAATAASLSRRTSAGGSVSSISSLPRAAGRTASGKQDLAAAGASAAMSRRG